MALILIRADNQNKILNALADLERHAKLKITGKPRIVPPQLANKVIKRILKEELKSKTKYAAMVKVKEDTTKSIMQIRKIHPPAHLMVISKEYEEHQELEDVFKELKSMKGYYSHKKNRPSS